MICNGCGEKWADGTEVCIKCGKVMLKAGEPAADYLPSFDELDRDLNYESKNYKKPIPGAPTPVVTPSAESPYGGAYGVKFRKDPLDIPSIIAAVIMILSVFPAYVYCRVEVRGVLNVDVEGSKRLLFEDGHYFILLAIFAISFCIKRVHIGTVAVGLGAVIFSVIKISTVDDILKGLESFYTHVDKGPGFYMMIFSAVLLLVTSIIHAVKE